MARTSFGITFIPQYPPETLVEYARQAEVAGFDSVWLYEDCFYGGGFSSAATILAATETIRVGIGLLPATVRNPVFAAMEIATLARLYPERFIPGFGHGFEPWMKQIGAPAANLKTLEETVQAVRALLSGEEMSLHGSHVQIERGKLLVIPQLIPPIYVGGVRAKTLRLAGQVGDGVLLSVLSSPAYVGWARQQIDAGAAGTRRARPTCCVSVICKVNPNRAAARAPVRRWLANCLKDGSAHLEALGIAEEVPALIRRYGVAEAAQQMPDTWIDALSASGTPEQAAAQIAQLVQAGADEIVLTPVELDPASLQETVHYLLPLLKK